jgi:hypothetical protein
MTFNSKLMGKLQVPGSMYFETKFAGETHHLEFVGFLRGDKGDYATPDSQGLTNIEMLYAAQEALGELAFARPDTEPSFVAPHYATLSMIQQMPEIFPDLRYFAVMSNTILNRKQGKEGSETTLVVGPVYSLDQEGNDHEQIGIIRNPRNEFRVEDFGIDDFGTYENPKVVGWDHHVMWPSLIAGGKYVKNLVVFNGSNTLPPPNRCPVITSSNMKSVIINTSIPLYGEDRVVTLPIVRRVKPEYFRRP